MCPHAQDADDFLVRKDLVDQTMMDIDPARVGARQVTDQLSNGGGRANRSLASTSSSAWVCFFK
jgi:hypothetical protein